MNKYLITVVVALFVGAASFFGGMKYQVTKTPVNQREQFFGNGNMRGNGQGFRQGDNTGRQMMNGRGNGQGFRPVNGEIISMDDKSITVKLDNGSTSLVLFSDSTAINKSETSSKADLKSGVEIAAFGNQNSDGSITAQSIQINPFRNGIGGINNSNSTPGALQ